MRRVGILYGVYSTGEFSQIFREILINASASSSPRISAIRCASESDFSCTARKDCMFSGTILTNVVRLSFPSHRSRYRFFTNESMVRFTRDYSILVSDTISLNETSPSPSARYRL